MSKALLVSGGYRIGDTFHMIPILRKLAEKHDSITWLTGKYAEVASRYLASVPSLKIKDLRVLDEYRKPGDITDRERFVSEVFKNDGRGNDKINPKDFDEVITDVRCSFEVAFNYKGYIGNYPELTELELPIKKESGEYICVQPDSISKQKVLKWLVDLPYPCKPVTLGLPGELLVRDSMDSRGVPFPEVVKFVYQSKFNVCLHSSFACLSFYLNKPTIICHFFDGQFKFGKYHSNCIDLITPSKKQLIDTMMRYKDGHF